MAIKGTDQAVTRREHDLTKEGKRIIGLDPFGGLITDGNFSQLVDVVDANTTYFCLAQIGTATSASKWQIKKIHTVGTVTTITWAESTDAFTNEADNRSSYSYA